MGARGKRHCWPDRSPYGLNPVSLFPNRRLLNEAGSFVKIAVFVPTFRRPQLLLAALESLRHQSCPNFQIVVSDNDGTNADGAKVASAWAVANDFQNRVRVTIAHERGLAQNRNHALRLAFDVLNVDFVAMIDDDSEAHPQWIERIVRACSTDAELIGGPTIYRLANEAPADIWHASLFGIPYAASDFVPRLRSSNNCVITRRLYDRYDGIVFDPKFGASGGEDSFLFLQEKQRGTRMWWQHDAVVYEDVPAERATLNWVADRQRTNGVNAARIDCRMNGAAVAWPRQLGLSLRDAMGGIRAIATSQDRAAISACFQNSRGRLEGLLGRISLHDSQLSRALTE